MEHGRMILTGEDGSTRTEVSPCWHRSDIRTGFPCSTLVFPYQYHSTTAPYQYSIYHRRYI